MKIGVVGDVHWSKYSSIVRSRGNKYSTRLENCIKSINWAEEVTKHCDLVVYLGDFFDKSDLSAEELSALNDLIWNDVPHKFLVGNHEMGLNDLSFSSSHTFNLHDNFEVIDEPTYMEQNNICFIPYILESDRKPFSKYVENKDSIVFSHNDIKGITMGKFVSNIGFDINEINENCKLFINGHIHNGEIINDKIINLGNLTGQNFSENAVEYRHKICILNDDDIEYIENPHAFNFMKFDLTCVDVSIDWLENIINMYGGSNPVVIYKIYQEQKSKIDDFINKKNITSRIIIEPKKQNERLIELPSLSINHLDEFNKYILDELGNDEIVLEELSVITN